MLKIKSKVFRTVILSNSFCNFLPSTKPNDLIQSNEQGLKIATVYLLDQPLRNLVFTQITTFMKAYSLIRSLVWSVSILMLTGLTTSFKEAASAPPKKYNILFIAVDDLRPELNCYGVKKIISPNIDKIARNGLLFERAYCQQAVCSPSRTSLLTGLRPDATRIYDLQTHFRKTVPDVVALPQYFKLNGYHTVSLGKIYHGTLDDPISWSEPSWKPNGRSLRGKGPKKENKPKNVGPAYEMADLPDQAYSDGMTAEKAIETMNRIKDKPFFLAVGFSKPHLPFFAPKKYWELYQEADMMVPDKNNPQNMPPLAMSNWGELRGYDNIPNDGPLSDQQTREMIHGYYASVSFMDAQVGKVMNELKRLGLDKNTIIVLWGDHGWKLGEYGAWSKHTNFELDVRAPLLASVPGMKAAGKKTRALVEFVDIYPSLCELAGLPLPKHLQGSSFAPLLNTPDKPWKKAVFSQFPREKDDRIMGYSIRTDTYRFTSWQQKNNAKEVIATELYDLASDPMGKVNLAASTAHAAKIKELSQLLEEGKQKGFAPGK